MAKDKSENPDAPKKKDKGGNSPENRRSRSKAAGNWGVYPKSISRIETEDYCAWFVRIHYEGAYVRRTFNDNKFGGKEDAFKEALQWRDDMEKQMGKPRTDRTVQKKNVVDGRDIGIYRRKARHVKRGRIYYRDIYEVTWCPKPGKVWRKTISVTKHGEEEALRMARAIREEKEREMFGDTIYERGEKTDF
jgi:hypothetical protein